MVLETCGSGMVVGSKTEVNVRFFNPGRVESFSPQ